MGGSRDSELSIGDVKRASETMSSNPAKQIYYSEKYYDDVFEYRHVMLPKEIAKMVPRNRLMTETEWRHLGVQQSQGWIHYLQHAPEPHILLFRRPITDHQAAERARQAVS